MQQVVVLGGRKREARERAVDGVREDVCLLL